MQRASAKEDEFVSCDEAGTVCFWSIEAKKAQVRCSLGFMVVVVVVVCMMYLLNLIILLYIFIDFLLK